MRDSLREIGVTAEGESVHGVTITGGGLTAKIMSWGAALQDLRLEGHDAPLTLGYDRFTDYLEYSPYFGQTPGRFGNRIGNGQYVLDGETFDVERNEGGKSHLHGGSKGMGKRVWAIADTTDAAVVLTLTDPDGSAGFPGDFHCTCTYELKPDGVLSIRYESRCAQATPANIVHHSYFNLDGSSDISAHELEIAADHYLPTNELQIPTGEIRAVSGTDFDFRISRPMMHEVDGAPVLYDHNFCLSRGREKMRKVVTAKSHLSGVSLDVRTTEPGVQFYAGFKLDGPLVGSGGHAFKRFAGFCLETQNWPDAPNHSDFPTAILRPGETLTQETEYIFSR